MPWKEKSVMELRTLFVLKASEPLANISELCREFGISRKTGYKWLKRYANEGFDGLKNLSQRPKSFPHEIDVDTCLEVIRLKKDHPEWGPKKIHALLGRRRNKESLPARITIERILDRAGYVKHVTKRKKRPPIPKRSIIQPSQPNDVWTVDFKGWWMTALGFRCEPLTVRDEFSRFVFLLKPLANSKTESVRREFEHLFKVYGLPSVIRFDNGQPFACTRAVARLTRLSVWFITLGIRVDPINPGHPQDNGGHERMHKDIRDQLEKKGIADQAAFDLWRHEFNRIRPHEALQMKTPYDVYQKSDRPFPAGTIDIVYPSVFEIRIVNHLGNVTYKKKSYFISSSLAGMRVGLKHTVTSRLEVWFDYLWLGEIDPEAQIFIRQEELV
jgi:transposase InsO family protein